MVSSELTGIEKKVANAFLNTSACTYIPGNKKRRGFGWIFLKYH
jgi:hypothetical protein